MGNVDKMLPLIKIYAWNGVHIVRSFYKYTYIYMFYSLNICEMRELLGTEHSIVKKIREVVQLLLTDAFFRRKILFAYKYQHFNTFKHFKHFKTLNSFGTDKQVTFHIRDMFKRKYRYICSSNRCPSKSFETNGAADFVGDMTLHTPKDNVGLRVEHSTKE